MKKTCVLVIFLFAFAASAEEPQAFHAAVWLEPLPTVFFGALSASAGFRALELPLGITLPVAKNVHLVAGGTLLEGVENCDLSPVLCRPFGFLSLRIGAEMLFPTATIEPSVSVFVLPQFIWTRYHEGQNEIVSHSVETGVEVGAQVVRGRLFLSTSLGVSGGLGYGVAASGSEYAIWSTWIRDASKHQNRFVWNLDLNLARIGFTF